MIEPITPQIFLIEYVVVTTVKRTGCNLFVGDRQQWPHVEVAFTRIANRPFSCRPLFHQDSGIKQTLEPGAVMVPRGTTPEQRRRLNLTQLQQQARESLGHARTHCDAAAS